MNRIVRAFFNSMRGFDRGWRTETAIRQELILLGAGAVLALFVAQSALQFAALVGVLLLLLAVEILNTAVEKLSDHVTPDWHESIGYIKDLGSAAVFCLLTVAGLVWGAILIDNYFWQ